MRAENAAGYEAEGEEEGDYRVYRAIIKPNGLLFKFSWSPGAYGAFGDVSMYVKRCQERFVSASFIVPFHHPLFWFSHPQKSSAEKNKSLIALFFKARELEGQVKQLNRKIQVQIWDVNFLRNMR